MKILYTSSHGAGWSTWNDKIPEVAVYMATHPGVIKRVEERYKELEGLSFGERYHADTLSQFDDVVQDMEIEILDKFGVDVYTGGARNLSIYETNNPVKITCFDGLESVKEIYNDGVVIYPQR